MSNKRSVSESSVVISMVTLATAGGTMCIFGLMAEAVAHPEGAMAWGLGFGIPFIGCGIFMLASYICLLSNADSAARGGEDVDAWKATARASRYERNLRLGSACMFALVMLAVIVLVLANLGDL
jgi:hypothetical protein